jgi:alanyl-tRNA synthetase
MSKPKTANDVREAFLEFFRSKGHEIVPSAPVYLPSDDTLLFVNAGMVPFKEIFLGARVPDHPRVADTQKCIRVSGKHNDLEEVGVDTYHHTFFEMLGNWSFGDYYKKEAITWAWAFLTEVLELPRDRLWVTVYTDDDEAMDLWQSETDITPDHILRFGEKDNFWEMGDTGPCGPCSEIHFDNTPEGTATADMVNADLPELLEIWNLVFIQYNRRADGSLEELPSKHVDTGMGFERLVATLQGKRSNYDSDVFMPYIDKLMELSGKPYQDEYAVAMRVIADHVRTLSVAISDGVTPSNEGRGYVLRRLLRRAALYGRTLGFEQPFMTELFPVVKDRLGRAFPNIVERGETIVHTIQGEEEGFVRNLDRGSGIFADLVQALEQEGREQVSGEEAFKLYDTYGFPIDMTQLMARECGLSVDEDGFKGILGDRRQRDRDRARRNDGESADLVADLVAQGVQSVFVGYDRTVHTTEVIAVLGEGQVLLKETPFYAESGGQLGDTGTITCGDKVFEVHDTQKPVQGILLHLGVFKTEAFSEGDGVQAAVDADRRQRLQRHHSATHVMNFALREVVGPDVRQAGSYVGPDRLRFDFTAQEAVTPGQLDAIEAMVNEHLMRNDPVVISEIPLKEIEGSGIIAVFDEKYGEVVRVVDIGGYSKELCGGTHVQQAGDVGPFRIVSESSVSAGVRRLEAVCGEEATSLTLKEHRLLKDLSTSLSVTAEEVPGRVSSLQKQVRKLEKELKQQAAKSALASLDDVLAGAIESTGFPLIAHDAGSMDLDSLRNLLDAIRQQFVQGVIVLGSENGGKACFVASVSPELIERGVNAGELIGQVAGMCGGGGGGKPDKAQAGGKDGSRVGEAIAAVPGMLA